MFIRLKKVKKRNGKVYEYAHLVRGVWRRKRLRREGEGKKSFVGYNNSVHKYSGFIGRVHRFDKIKEKLNSDKFFDGEFKNFVNCSEIENIYEKLIEYELLSRGFIKRGKVLNSGNIFVDLNRKIVHDGNSDVVIKLKDFGGYLCSLNLDELFSIKNIQNKQDGIYLMKKLRQNGINLKPDEFYLLAEKMLKTGE